MLLLLEVVVQQLRGVCAAAAAATIPLLAPVCRALPANAVLTVDAAGLAGRHGSCSLRCHDRCGHINGSGSQPPATAWDGGGRQPCRLTWLVQAGAATTAHHHVGYGRCLLCSSTAGGSTMLPALVARDRLAQVLLLVLALLPGAGEAPGSHAQQGDAPQCGTNSYSHQLTRGQDPGSSGPPCNAGGWVGG